MNLFSDMKTEGIEKAGDRLGGFQVYDTDIYTGKIKAMYAGEASSGAKSITVELDLGNGRTYRQTIYITSGTAKGGKHFYVKDGKNYPLPGFTVINNICMIATGKELFQQTTEEKTINIYNFETSKEEPTGVNMLVDCLDQEVAIGLIKQTVDKKKKNDSTGEYEATGETREENEIDTVFHPEYKLTVAEVEAGFTPEKAAFWDAWLKKNQGKTRDRTEKSSSGGGKGGTPPQPGAGMPTAKVSLFAKK